MPTLKTGSDVKTGRVADGTSIGASFLCLAHCLLLPIIIAFAPAASRLIDIPEKFHIAVVILAIPISSFAIVIGHRRHGAWLPVALAGVGLLLLGVGAMAGLPLVAETSVTTIGSVILALGHLRNWRMQSPNASALTTNLQ